MRGSKPVGGFTLLELMLVVLLLALMLALGVLHLGRGLGGTDARAVAAEVAAELRRARQTAMANQVPVAVVFPSDGGSRPHSQGYYLAQGDSQPRITRVVDLSGEHGRAVLFAGYWDTGGGAVIGPTLPGHKAEDLDLDSWLTPALKQDFCFVFTPSGGVTTNDLPFFNGGYQLVAAAGVQYAYATAPPGTPSVIPPPPYYKATAAGRPYTISISPAGAVTVTSGLVGASASIPIEPSVGLAYPPAPLPSLPGSSNHAPAFDTIQVSPAADPVALPAGVDVTCRGDGHLTLDVTATDQDGDELYVDWTGTGGSFSSPGEERMRWDAAAAHWVSTWQWTPPSSAGPGDPFTLTCQVRDPSGDVAASIGGSVQEVQSLGTQSLYFSRKVGSRYEVWRINPDGSGEERVVPYVELQDFVVTFPHPTQDGKRFTYVAGSALSAQVYLRNADGTGRVQVTTGGAVKFNAALSPRGDRLAFMAWTGSYRLFTVDADGTNLQQWYDTLDSGTTYHHLSWSPDGGYVVLNDVVNANPKYDVILVDVAAPVNPPVYLTEGVVGLNPNIPDLNPCWSWDPADPWIYFASWGIYKIRPDKSGLTQITSSYAFGPALSSDATQIVYTDVGNNLWIVDSGGATTPRQLTTSAWYPRWGP